jgi:hypothetical protein
MSGNVFAAQAEQASGPGSAPDVLILGCGLTGSVVALELLRLDPSVRVLVLESGTEAAEDHGQSVLAGPGFFDDLFAERWLATSRFAPAGMVEVLGGASVAWSGWSPRPRPSELAGWPAPVTAALDGGLLDEAERWLGVSTRHSANALAARLSASFAAEPRDSRLRHLKAGPWPAPIALAPQGHAFSTVPRLRAALDAEGDRLRIVTDCRVLSLETGEGRVSAVLTSHGRLPVAAGTRVVLALGTVESARHAMLVSPRIEAAGARITTHVVSDLTLRVPLDEPHREFAWAALLLPGRVDDRHFHIQVHAAVGPVGGPRAAFLRREVPGLYGEEILAGTDERHMVVSLVGIGELPPGESQDGAIVLSRSHPDSLGLPLASVSARADAEDDRVVHAMDDAIDGLCDLLARPGVQYRSDTDGPDDWREDRPGRHSDPGGRHWDRCVHEAGSLPMSAGPGGGATDTDGAVLGIRDLYATGLAIFPRGGSHNGGLTATALALRLARHLCGDRP